MSNGITLNLSELKATFKRKLEVTKRDIPTMLNTAGFYISRGAVNSTVKVAVNTIRNELDALLRPTGTGLGKFFDQAYPQIAKRYYQSRTVNRGGKEVPLVALLINAKRGKSGQKGLQGADMQQAADNFKANRVKSAAFIASGFIPAIKAFEPLAERKGQAPPRSSEAKELGIGRQIGYGITAQPSFVAFAVIVNTAASLDDQGKALEIFGTRGLQIAINDEVRSMQQYIERKMKERESE